MNIIKRMIGKLNASKRDRHTSSGARTGVPAFNHRHFHFLFIFIFLKIFQWIQISRIIFSGFYFRTTRVLIKFILSRFYC